MSNISKEAKRTKRRDAKKSAKRATTHRAVVRAQNERERTAFFKTVSNITNTKLSRLIGAKSYTCDKALVRAGFDPEELRSTYDSIFARGGASTPSLRELDVQIRGSELHNEDIRLVYESEFDVVEESTCEDWSLGIASERSTFNSGIIMYLSTNREIRCRKFEKCTTYTDPASWGGCYNELVVDHDVKLDEEDIDIKTALIYIGSEIDEIIVEFGIRELCLQLRELVE